MRRCALAAARVVLAALAALGALLSPSTESASAGVPLLPPIPRDWPAWFALGLDNEIDRADLLAATGAPWDFRYQYLSGGVDTGRGWTTWRSPAGTFARDYLRESQARGYRTLFIYYLLRDSGSGASTDEQTAMLTNLRNPVLMQTYYADFSLLLDQIAAFSDPVWIIVEPDLWGYAQNTVVGRTNDGRDVPAAVRATGLPLLADLPDTLAGFASALVRLRDQRAPNARLLFHVNTWSTGADAALETWEGRWAPDIATKTADFLRTINVRPGSGWDALSLDIANASAGYYEVVKGEDRWWDRTNRKRPHFEFFFSYLQALIQTTGFRVALWQIPLGNQVYRTLNNTPGHYQDNKAEILFANLDRLNAAGVIALLFGDPLADDTSYWDKRRDGITNPEPIVARDCNRCNTKVAIYPDDDGGYLREQALAYYRNRLLLPLGLRYRLLIPLLPLAPVPSHPAQGMPPHP
jgi:hypothetical protein